MNYQKMKSEISLFSCRIIWNNGWQCTLGLNFNLPFEVFDYKVAAVTL